jgi:acetyltransferase-like isoleucine patch superfamily enzyme
MLDKKYLIDRIIFRRNFLFLFELILDRILYFVYYKKYYKRKFKYYGDNIKWGRDFQWKLIPRNIRISNPDKIQIFDGCMIDSYVYLQAHHLSDGLIIGPNTRINSNTHIQAYSEIILEEKVLIAPFVHINSGNHGYYDQHEPIMDQEYLSAGKILIGKGTWIGRGATVLGGVKLGNNTVVGTAAVVTKSFLTNTVLVGIPARPIIK